MNRKLLESLGLASNVETFYPRTRDREDISVLRDVESGILFLSRFDHINNYHYKGIVHDQNSITHQMEKDDIRRYTQFEDIITSKAILDYGAGAGGFASLAANISDTHSYDLCIPIGGNATALDTIPHDAQYDVITMFHVLEHLTEPIETLQQLYLNLKPGGHLIIEVPHARDILLNIEAFRAKSLWSEHLILHTRISLLAFLRAAGFKQIGITGYQRYDYLNHVKWGFEFTQPPEELRSTLFGSDQTDTLIAIATK